MSNTRMEFCGAGKKLKREMQTATRVKSLLFLQQFRFLIKKRANINSTAFNCHFSRSRFHAAVGKSEKAINPFTNVPSDSIYWKKGVKMTSLDPLKVHLKNHHVPLSVSALHGSVDSPWHVSSEIHGKQQEFMLMTHISQCMFLHFTMHLLVLFGFFGNKNTKFSHRTFVYLPLMMIYILWMFSGNPNQITAHEMSLFANTNLCWFVFVDKEICII